MFPNDDSTVFYADYTIDDWAIMFNKIYKEKNQGYNLVDYTRRLHEEAGELMLPIEQQDFLELRKQIPDIFAWVCGISNKIGINLQEITWDRYKNGCPSCKKYTNCECVNVGISSKNKSITISKQLTFDERIYDEPKNLDEWQSIFNQIYGERNRELSPSLILSRLMQTIIELRRSVEGNHDNKKIQEIIATIFAWTCALCNRYSMGTIAISLMSLVANKYQNSCPKCHSNPCVDKETIGQVYITFSTEYNNMIPKLEKFMVDQIHLSLIYESSEDNIIPSLPRMKKSFSKIDDSNIAIVLIHTKLNQECLADLMMINYKIKRNNVLIFREGVSPFGTHMQDFLPVLGKEFGIEVFRDLNDLKRLIKKAIIKRK